MNVMQSAERRGERVGDGSAGDSSDRSIDRSSGASDHVKIEEKQKNKKQSQREMDALSHPQQVKARWNDINVSHWVGWLIGGNYAAGADDSKQSGVGHFEGCNRWDDTASGTRTTSRNLNNGPDQNASLRLAVMNSLMQERENQFLKERLAAEKVVSRSHEQLADTLWLQRGHITLESRLPPLLRPSVY
jgi:hypothetical protein